MGHFFMPFMFFIVNNVQPTAPRGRRSAVPSGLKWIGGAVPGLTPWAKSVAPLGLNARAHALDLEFGRNT